MNAPPEFRVAHTAGAAVVSLRAAWPGGATAESLPGLASVMGSGLSEGSQRRDWRQLAEDAEALGASIQCGASFEAVGLSIDAMAADWVRVLDWAQELLLEPVFPHDRCRWLARQAAAELESMADQPDVVAQRAFLEHLYLPHPRSRPLKGDEASLQRVDGDACSEFYRAHRAAGPLLLSVAGPIDEEAVLRGLEERFSPRLLAQALASGPSRELATPPKIEGNPQRRREVKLPAQGDQAHVYAGHLTVPQSHPDATALQVLAVILGAGGGLHGRIPHRIREQEGLAYSAYAHTLAGAGLAPGRLTLYAGTAAAQAARVETGLVEELERLVEEGPEAAEVEEARTFLLGRDPFLRETPRQVASLMVDSAFYGLPMDDPEWRRGQLEAVDREVAERVARRWLRPDQLRITVGLP
ncbi:MAG: pitrilysin family protein [Acidobacteriota bacterium]